MTLPFPRLIARLRTASGRRAAAAACLILLALLAHYALVPLCRQWSALRALALAQSSEYARLAANVSLRSAVDAEFAQLSPDAFQTASGQATLSAWLRDLESLARHPGVFLVNMRAQPIQQTPSSNSYGVKVSVSGRLPEVVRFISSAATASTGAGLESFQLRGVQGDGSVECLLSLRMVKLRQFPAVSSSKGPSSHDQ